MIVDTSALIAILLDEPEGRGFSAAIAQARSRIVAAGNWIEFATVLVRKLKEPDPNAVQQALASKLGLEIAPVNERQATIASRAYADFGIGSGHRARLNFGDCFAYALARTTGEPLLFKGDDFNHTDLLLADASAHPR